MIEPGTGVFLGNPSARIRDKLWELVLEKVKEGSALQIWSDSRRAQGYRYRSCGTPKRRMIDFDGMALILRPGRIPKNKKAIAKNSSKE